MVVPASWPVGLNAWRQVPCSKTARCCISERLPQALLLVMGLGRGLRLVLLLSYQVFPTVSASALHSRHLQGRYCWWVKQVRIPSSDVSCAMVWLLVG